MKKNAVLLVLLMTAVLCIYSCSDDKESDITEVYTSYGVVEAAGSEATNVFGILTDSGKRLYPKSALNVAQTDGDRVIVRYMLDEGMDSQQGNQIVEIVNIETIHVQDLLSVEYSSTEYIDSLSIGQHIHNGSIVNVEDIWAGGNFLNVKYRLVTRKNSDVEHYVNCVIYGVTTSPTNGTTINIALCHGADNFRTGVKEKPTENDLDEFEYGPVQMISFDLSMLSQYAPSLNMKIHWDAYDNMTWIGSYICTYADELTYPVTVDGQIPELTKHETITN